MPSHKGNSRRHAEHTKPTIVVPKRCLRTWGDREQVSTIQHFLGNRTPAVRHEVNDTVTPVPMARVEWSASRSGTTLATLDPYRLTR